MAPLQSVFKKALQSAIQVTLQIELPLERIRIERGVAHLEVNPMIRGELMLKKTEILTRVNEELKGFGRSLTDIR